MLNNYTLVDSMFSIIVFSCYIYIYACPCNEFLKDDFALRYLEVRWTTTSPTSGQCGDCHVLGCGSRCDTSRVKTVKLQTLKHEFETLKLKNNEVVPGFVSRVLGVVNQMRSFRDNIAKHLAKVLRSLTLRFDYIVSATEESKDMSMPSMDELRGSLQAHETRIN